MFSGKLQRLSFDRRGFARRLVRSKLLWSLAALLLLYTLGGFLLAPYLIERYLPSIAQEQLGRRAVVERVRINPYLLTFEASGFRLDGTGEKALLTFKRFFIDFELSSVFRRAWTFGDVSLEGADLGLEIDRKARLNLLDVLDRLLKSSDPDAPATRVIVGRLAIQDSRVSLTDLSGAVRADAVYSPINLELRNLSTLVDREGAYRLSGGLPAGGRFAWKGRFSLQPISSAGELAIEHMKLENVWQFRRAELRPTELRGDASFKGHYEFGYTQGRAVLVVNGLEAALSKLTLALQGEKAPLLALGKLEFSDATLALSSHEIALRKLVLADGALNLIVSDSGTLNWARMTTPTQAPAPAPEAAAAAPSTEQPWRIRLPDARVEKVAVVYADRSVAPALEVRSAALNGGLNLDITTGAGPFQLVANNIGFTLDTNGIAIPDSTTRYVSLDALTVTGGSVDVQQRSVHAAAVDFKRGNVALAIGADGPEGLIKALSSPAPANNVAREAAKGVGEDNVSATESSPAPATQPWHVKLDKVALEKLALQYDHKSAGSAASIRAEEVNSSFSVDMTAGSDATRTLAGDLQLAVDRVKLAAAGDATPLATLDSLRVSGGHIDTGQRSAAAKSIALTGGGVRLARQANGALPLMDVFTPKQADTVAKPARRARAEGATRAARAAKPASSDEWRYRLDALALNRFTAALSDGSYEPAIAYNVEIAAIEAKNIDSQSRKRIAFTAALRVAKEGTANAEGTVRQDFDAANAKLTLARIPVVPLRPLISKYALLDLKSGQLSGKTVVKYQSSGKPTLDARGELAIDDVLVNEAGSDERFASWKTLSADGIVFNLSPDSVAINDIRVVEPGGKIVIAKDRTINITKMIRKDAAPANGAAKPPARSTDTSTGTPPFPYEIATIRFENGALDFADLSLVLPFATHVHTVNGAIVGLSSKQDARAELKLTGEIDKYGEARADGTLIPRDPEKFLDITARFNNVDMASLSPYSATFAGRKIDQGKLGLVLEYKIVNSELAGENRIVLQEFKLGERVEAPGAMNLPLDLAVALLRDSDGKINLEVPVRGNVGNPDFDYSKVIRAAIANVLTRIVTAPFRALAALFGKHDSEAVRTVSFAPGSDSIAPAQREELDAVAKALSARPQLRVVVKGPYDTGPDKRELQRRAARLELARAMEANLKPGEDPGPIAYGRADTQKALEALLTRRAGPDALPQLEKSFAQKTGRQAERVNPLLGFLGRGSKDTEFYEAVFQRVVETQPLPDTAVRGLAESRATAIIDTLAKAGLDRARLTSGGITEVKVDAAKGVQTELALEATGG